MRVKRLLIKIFIKQKQNRKIMSEFLHEIFRIGLYNKNIVTVQAVGGYGISKICLIDSFGYDSHFPRDKIGTIR